MSLDASQNHPPEVAKDTASVTVGEGQPAINAGTYNDLNASDNVTVTASVGTVTKTGTNSGTWHWSYTTTDGPAQSQNVTITADDGHSEPASVTFPLTVNNVPPQASVSGPSEGLRGDTLTFTLNATDPSPVDQRAVCLHDRLG